MYKKTWSNWVPIPVIGLWLASKNTKDFIKQDPYEFGVVMFHVLVTILFFLSMVCLLR